MEQLPSEKSLTPGLEPTTIGFDREIATGASDHCATTETTEDEIKTKDDDQDKRSTMRKSYLK